MAQPELTVITPTYNEREAIVDVLRDLSEALRDVETEFVVVDDNSPDGTADAVREAFAGDASVRVIVRTQIRGLALSIREGIEASTGHFLLVMDSDGNHSPADAHTMYQICRLVDVVVGSRFVYGGGMADRRRYFASYTYNLFMRFMIGTQIDDNLSGFFCIRRDRLMKFDFDKIFWGYGDYFFRLLKFVQRDKLRLVELPVFYGPRRGGTSKTAILNILVLYTWEVFKLSFWRITGRW
jgi:dolichol-phosphate mannosyltransferase